MAKTNEDIKEAIDTLLNDYFDAQLNKSDVEDEDELDEEEIEAQLEKAESEEEGDDDSDLEKAGDEEEEEEDEDEGEEKGKKKKAKKDKKDCEKSLKLTNVPIASSKDDMIPDANGDMTPERVKKGTKMEKSQTALSDDERTELEAFRKAEREAQAEKIQKSIQSEKDAQDERFGTLESKLNEISENLGKVMNGPAYRRLSKSGSEDLSKSTDTEVKKETNIQDAVLAKSHPEAAKVLDVLFAMQKEDLAKAKDIICFENTGDVADPEVKRALIGRLASKAA